MCPHQAAPRVFLHLPTSHQPHNPSAWLSLPGSPRSPRTPSPYSKALTKHFVSAADLTLSSQAPANPHELGSQDQPLHTESPHKDSTQGWPQPSLHPCSRGQPRSQGHSAFVPLNMSTKPEVPLRGQSIPELTLGHLYVCIILFFSWK